MVPPGDGHSFYLSHPRRGKHVVFDGGLLHCVPAKLSCRPPSSPKAAATADAAGAADMPSPPHATQGGSGGGRRRATVLVNVWLNYRPEATAALPPGVRAQLTALAADASVGLPACTDGPLGAPLLAAQRGGSDDGEELRFGYGLVGPDDGTTLTLICRVPGGALAPAAAGATFELPLLDVPLPTSGCATSKGDSKGREAGAPGGGLGGGGAAGREGRGLLGRSGRGMAAMAS